MTPTRRRARTTLPTLGVGLAVAAASAVTAPAAQAAPAVAASRTSALPHLRPAAVVSAAAPTATRPQAPATDSTHVVARGDTVGEIARTTGSTVGAIVAANHLDSRAFIRIGQVLVIPGAASPAPSAAPSAPATSTGAQHVVVAGDTVSELAIRYGSTVSAIVAANGLGPRAAIRVGQRLLIPGEASGATATPTSTPAPAGSVAHVVAAGDTVSGLAARYHSSVARIVSANGLDSRATIRVGQHLTIPTGAATASTSMPSTFAGRTYPAATVAAATANRDALLARAVPSRSETQALVRGTAVALGVDPALAQAVAFQESGFNQRAVSPANAVGTMQVIPSSGVWASQLVGRPLDLLETRDNVTAGVAILRALVRTAPDLDSAIAGYYQGLGSVRRNGMYADTQRYVASVRSLMTRFG